MSLKVLEGSFSLLRKNPILYLPDLVVGIISSFMLYILFLYTGAGSLLQLLQVAEPSIDIITGFVSENLKELIISLAVFIFVSFILGVSVRIFKFSMMRELLEGKKISLLNSWKERKGYFLPVVFLRILLFCIQLIALIAVAVLALGVFFLVGSVFPEKTATFFAVALAILFGVAALIYINILFVFRYPMMFLKKVKSPKKILQESYKIFQKNPWYNLKTWLVVFLLIIIFGTLSYILGSIIGIILPFFSSAILVTIISSLWSVLNKIINITVDLWSTLYVFVQYKKKSKE